MDEYRWETVDKFLEWLTQEKQQYFEKSKAYFKKLESGETEPNKDIRGENSKALMCIDVSIPLFRHYVDNSILKLFNDCYYGGLNTVGLTIYHLQLFIRAIDQIQFFKKSKLSADYNEYKREIKSLKKKADQLQPYSQTSISIRIPVFPTVIIYELVSHLKRHGINTEVIKLMNEYFSKEYGVSSSKRLPKKPTALNDVREHRLNTYKNVKQRMSPVDTGWIDELIGYDEIFEIARKEQNIYTTDLRKSLIAKKNLK